MISKWSKQDLSTLPTLKDVYITMLPGGDYKETAEQAVKLVQNGFNPIPSLLPTSIILQYTRQETDQQWSVFLVAHVVTI